METIFITGANRGLGLALCEYFLARNWRVLATCRKPQAAESLLALQAMGNLELLRLEVSNAEELADCCRQLAGTPIDVVVNNAGVMGGDHQGLRDMDYAAWQQTLDINVLAPFRIITSLLPNLELSPRPRVITLSSQMGAFGLNLGTGSYAYRSSKSAVSKVMQVMAMELRDSGVVVCPVHPGWVKTDMGGSSAKITPEESAAGLYALINRLTLKESGRFWTWDGREHVW